MIWNQTFTEAVFRILHFEDLVWEPNPAYWRLILKLNVWLMGMCLESIILSYLKSKSPGQQSVMDTVHIFFFKTTICARLLAMVQDTAEAFTIDTGELIAQVLGWPIYIVVLTYITSLLVNSLVQAVLVFWSQAMEASALESIVEVGLLRGAPIGNTCISIVFFCLGSTTHAYVSLRNIEEDGQLSLCSMLAGMMILATLISLLISRTAIAIWERGRCCFGAHPGRVLHQL